MALEALRELRGYRRLYATTNLLVLCAFLIWAYFSLDLTHNAVPAVAVAAWSLFTLAYHGLLPDRRFTWRMLFYGNLVDLGFATVLIWFSGRESSPFFFVYLLTIMGAALTLGLRQCFALAALASALYLVVGTTALSELVAMPQALLQGGAAQGAPDLGAVNPRTLLNLSAGITLTLARGVGQLWANLAALWLTAYVAGFFAQETRRVRASVQEARDKVEGFSRIDWLTGLYNRRHFDYLLAQEVARAGRYERPLSVLIVDSDNLKIVNDTYGHQAGDHLIATLANVLRTEMRLSDTLVRYGGDEFVVLLPQTGKDQALVVAKRLRDGLRASCFCREEGLNLNVRASIGVATYPHDARSAHDVIRQADGMMYMVKNSTRDNIGIAQRGMLKE